MEPPNTQTLRQLERDIVRYLDGELDPDQRLALSQRLRQDEGARRMLREYAAVDRMSCEALLAALDAPASSRPRSVHRPLRVMALVGPVAALAAAAVLALAIWPAFGPRDDSDRGSGVEAPIHATPVSAGLWPSLPGRDYPLDRSGDLGAGRGQRQVDRQVYGVFDHKVKRFYVLEVDRVQTQVQQDSWDF